MTAEIVKLTPEAIGDGIQLQPDEILKGALGNLHDACVIVGLQEDGSLYVAGTGSVAESNFLLDQAKAFFVRHALSDR